MIGSNLIRFTITAPDMDNAGRPAPEFGAFYYSDYARRMILQRFDGATAAPARGYWTNPETGEYHAEPVTVWTIDAGEDRAGAIIRAAELIGAYADQIAVYVTATGPAGFRAVTINPRFMPRDIVSQLIGALAPVSRVAA